MLLMILIGPQITEFLVNCLGHSSKVVCFLSILYLLVLVKTNHLTNSIWRVRLFRIRNVLIIKLLLRAGHLSNLNLLSQIKGVCISQLATNCWATRVVGKSLCWWLHPAFLIQYLNPEGHSHIIHTFSFSLNHYYNFQCLKWNKKTCSVIW